MLEIALINKTKPRFAIAGIWFRKNLHQISDFLPSKDQKILKKMSALTVVLVGLKEGRELNALHRKKNYATDILSFAPVEPESLGELVFCWPVIKLQAKEHELTPRDELLYMFIHGLLHLLGYEHEKSDKAARAMYRLQDSIFDKLRGS